MIKAMENNFSRVIYHNTKEFKNNNMDKESLSNLMINSIDNFNTAQGKYRYLSKTGGYDLDIEFQVNYNDTPNFRSCYMVHLSHHMKKIFHYYQVM